MFEISTTFNGRAPAHMVRAERGAIRKLPGGVRLRFGQGRALAEVCMTDDEARRLVRAISSVLPRVSP